MAPKPSLEAGAPAAEVVDAMLAILARRFREPLSLDELGRCSGYSVFHLSRIFRERSGLTLHAWQNRLRLFTALERVAEPGTELGELAAELGYSSHSHLTASFRSAFGVTPSAFRATATPGRVREMAEALRKSAVRR
jgi:AraC family transcriptional regulator